MLLPFLVACLGLPVPDPSDLPVPTPEPASIRVEALGEVFLLEPDDVTLRRLPEGVDVLEVHADGDTSSLDLFVSHSDGLATGDFFALGQWGDSVVDSNAIAFGGLAGGEVFAASTSSAAGTFAEGTLRLDALDHDASTVSLSFEGELYLTADGSAGDAMVGVSGEALDLVFTEDAG